ncbi:MAG: hypothetical protein PHD31_00625 [Candidatus Pacebacteria bacterium]|nr:hypothetical protein [Candidatus Paceibacterota bacterium]
MLQKMPETEEEKKNTRPSWTGPERTSYLAIVTTWLMYGIASFLLFSGKIVVIIFGIGIAVFAVAILTTTSILAFIVINQKRKNAIPCQPP